MRYQLPKHFLIKPVLKESNHSKGLTLFFGSLGLFYSTVFGGIIMAIVEYAILLHNRYGLNDFGLMLFELAITHGVCVFWGLSAVRKYNHKQLSR